VVPRFCDEILKSKTGIRDFLEMRMFRNSPRAPEASCGARRNLGYYAIWSGGCGAGRGEPLAVRVLNTGGCGAGRGEPLAVRALNTGGCGAGRGEPLAVKVLDTGGCGAGRGEPLAVKVLNTGGCGAGRGEPLLRAAEIGEAPLLDKCLTELLTGSTIETAKASIAR